MQALKPTSPARQNDVLFERRELLQNAQAPFFPNLGEKVSTFQQNKFKNERSIIDFSQSLSDVQLMLALSQRNRRETDSLLQDLG